MASLSRIFSRNFHISARRHALSRFTMPAMSPTMTEGGIASWKKKEGESYQSGDVLLEIETDKATIDVEAQEDGILAKIISEDGTKGIPVGTTIAILAEEGDDLSGAADMAKQAASEAPTTQGESKPEEPPKKDESPKDSSREESSSKPKEDKAKSELKTGDRIFATPIAKKIALERGIPLAQVKGSGPEGRILREDVEKFKGVAASSAGATPTPAPASADQYTDTPVSSMRRVIGQRLTQSKQELPHYYVTVDVDMTKVTKLRAVFNESLAGKEGAVKLSVNDFIMKAVALALAEVPEANSAWLGEVIRQYKKADISMAVATPNGLITPIVKDVGSKGLAAIALESKALAKKAREGKLAPHEYQGGTFTVSNMGMFGVSHFTAIINPPQSCILAVASPVATMVPDASDEKGWTTKQIMKVTLSSDHRTVDGAIAARWLQSFKGYLENPLTTSTFSLVHRVSLAQFAYQKAFAEATAITPTVEDSAPTMTVKNKVCLIVHDGWGISDIEEGNAVKGGDTETMDRLAKDFSYRTIAAHGLAVGLSDGLMGNSEVGHLNIGAGRIVWQDIVRIDQSIRKKQFHQSEVIRKSMQHAKDTNGRLHLLGLVSDGGVHSHITHLYALLETAKEMEVPECYIHFFGDGRDTAPRSAKKYAEELIDFCKKLEYGEIATVVGRYYAMDRDKRWERVKIAVDGLVQGVGQETDDVLGLIEEKYKEDQTDEFLKPIICGGPKSRIQDDDSLFFFNYRSDRMREIVSVFGLDPKPMKVEVPSNLTITTMSRYNTEFAFPVAFPPQGMNNVLADWLSKQGVKQMHVAETEKYAHVTFFFNGGVEPQFEHEDRFLIDSPKVATYDLQPEMSALKVADKVAEVVKSKEYEFVMCNFAPPDMVGHTEKYEPAVEAISQTDKAVKTVYEACKEAGYILLVTADHGNAEQMVNAETGAPHTAHTTNPVSFIMTADPKVYSFAEDGEGTEEGALCDVAPTILALMGLEKPEDMTGRSLLAVQEEKK